MLQELGSDQGFLKAGFLGFQSSGKTFTSVLLALGVRKHFGLEGPLGMFDTEQGSPYLNRMVRDATGKPIVGVRGRSFDDLCAATREAESAGVSVWIVDSITHVWRELCKAYLTQINEKRMKQQRGIQARLEFQDWNAIKDRWSVWTDLYLNSRLHLIVCGRAGYEYEFEEREDGSGKDLVKTGIKMKTEGEFGYEPSLLVNMVQEQDVEGKNVTITRRATVLKDRFNVLDGQSCINPGFEFFLPHIQLLTPGGHSPIDTAVKTDFGFQEDGGDYRREATTKAILAEEIQGVMVSAWPGQTAAEKKIKTDALQKCFGTRSWVAVERMEVERLRAGLKQLKAMVEPAEPEPPGSAVDEAPGGEVPEVQEKPE